MFKQEIILTGRVSQMGEFRVIVEKDNLMVQPFSIATDINYPTSETDKETAFLDFAVFGEKAENFANSVQVGDIIQVKFQIINDVQRVVDTNVHGYRLRLLGYSYVYLKKWAQGNRTDN